MAKSKAVESIMKKGDQFLIVRDDSEESYHREKNSFQLEICQKFAYETIKNSFQTRNFK